ncbi:MAG: hypothetical protein JNM27_19965 [Leptospirales bacterium]|nr:hypothetical protein [Leptospirales bacterium]
MRNSRTIIGFASLFFLAGACQKPNNLIIRDFLFKSGHIEMALAPMPHAVQASAELQFYIPASNRPQERFACTFLRGNPRNGNPDEFFCQGAIQDWYYSCVDLHIKLTLMDGALEHFDSRHEVLRTSHQRPFWPDFCARTTHNNK